MEEQRDEAGEELTKPGSKITRSPQAPCSTWTPEATAAPPSTVLCIFSAERTSKERSIIRSSVHLTNMY